MTTRNLDFSDGFQSSSAPTEGEIDVNGLKVFADDSAFVTDKGSAAAAGDIYFNSTNGFLRLHNGTSWSNYVDDATAQSIGGDKTLTGTTTTVNSTNLEVTDKNININDGGNDASAEGAGLNVERTGTDGSLVYEDALASKWKCGAAGSEVQIADISSSQTFTNKTIDGSVNTITNVDVTTPPRIGFENLSLVNATTTNSNDSVKITSADGTALSGPNAGKVTIMDTTAGQLVEVSVTADVTINLTGAHWNFGTNGDLTDQTLSVLALYDGSLKWGISLDGGKQIVLNTEDSATATDINLWNEVLVNSALTADATALHFAYFKANFDDTGGAAEDLWSVQTGIDDIVVGPNIHKLRQTKYLSAAVTSTGVMADLTFSNLFSGDELELSGIFSYDETGSNHNNNVTLIEVDSGATLIGTSRTGIEDTGAALNFDTWRDAAGVNIKFTSQGTSVTSDVTQVPSGSRVVGTGDANATFLTLEKLSAGGVFPRKCIFS